MKMTTVNVDAPILDIDGKPVPDLVAKKIMVDALLVSLEEDQRLPGEQKIKNFVLAQRISVGGHVDLTAEEVSLVKARVAKAFNVLATGRIWELLDPASIVRV